MVGRHPTAQCSLQTISLVDSYKTVHEYWTPSEGWRWNLITGLLPSHIEDRLHAVLVRKDADNKDGMCWGLTSHGQCTIRTTYALTKKNPNHPPDKV